MPHAICFAVIGIAATTLLSSSAVVAARYPYCIKSAEGGGCWYENYEQCRASAADTGRECFVDVTLSAARPVGGGKETRK
ncbi:hypothetical protein J2W51_003880 [Tardiphaga robiniae]|uniref:DUF3551 domain-containing protein n=1 Tax=Tardiphaga robiniae TaxID=943830 RepID=UPI00285C354F|nr:hypothetical protein [Tardiphaga robiniae]